MYVRLKKVRGGVMGFGDTLGSKTCHFLGSHVRGQRGGGVGSINLVFYGNTFSL